MFEKINKIIIEVFGISNLPKEKIDDVMNRLGVSVYGGIVIRALDSMSKEDVSAFEKLVSTNPEPEELINFLGGKVPNLEEIAREEAGDVKEDNPNL